MKTRKEKISFLKGLMKGERKLHEIKEGRQIFLIRRSGADTYRESPSGKVWTDDEIKLHVNQHPEDVINKILIVRSS
ncbi:MAG: hypothetical protein ACKOX7_11100 [Bacteroidota bacterium]